jgi:hypothetical protein
MADEIPANDPPATIEPNVMLAWIKSIDEHAEKQEKLLDKIDGKLGCLIALLIGGAAIGALLGFLSGLLRL